MDLKNGIFSAKNGNLRDFFSCLNGAGVLLYWGAETLCGESGTVGMILGLFTLSLPQGRKEVDGKGKRLQTGLFFWALSRIEHLRLFLSFGFFRAEG